MVRGEKNLCPKLPVPLDTPPAVLVAALLLNLALQGCLPTAPGAELILTSLNQLMISYHRKPRCGMMADYKVPSTTDTP